MLGNVALRSTNRVDDLLHASILIANDTEDLQAQGMRDRLQRPCCLFDVLLLVDDAGPDGHAAPDSSFII